MLLFREMAFIRCFLPTSSTTNACRVGASKALTVPSAKAMIPTITRLGVGLAALTMPVSVNPARMAARIIATTWVTINRVRRGTRSAATPPTSPNSRIGTDCAPVTTPSISGEWEMVQTSHP